MSKGIYCYIDKKDNQIVYVGKDSNIDTNERHKQHFQPSKYNNQPINRILQNNPDRYIHQVLWEIDDCTNNHLNQMEIYYIKKYDPQFNFTEGGDGISGFKHSEETKKKISKSLKGKKPYEITEETRKKMSEAKKGKTPWNKGKVNVYSGETIKKISEAKKGKKPYEMTEETRKKMSEANNTTGIYRVSKQNCPLCKKGFRWRYEYRLDSQQKSIKSTDLKKLKKKIETQGLPWEIIDEEKAKKSLRENEVCT